MINFQVHGALEILSLSVIACGCGVKLKWQGAKFYFTHKRTLFKVRGFTPTCAHYQLLTVGTYSFASMLPFCDFPHLFVSCLYKLDEIVVY